MASRVIAGCGIVCESLLSCISFGWNEVGSPVVNAVVMCFAILVPVIVALGGCMLEPFDVLTADERHEGVQG